MVVLISDSAFTTSWVLLIYSYLLWLICTLVSIQTGRKFYSCDRHMVSIVMVFVLSIQMYFIFWLVMARMSIHLIFNKFSHLILDHQQLFLNSIECYTPYFPMMVFLPSKIFFNFKQMTLSPFLTFLDIFQSFGMLFTNGLIYTWILSAEKFCFAIDQQIRLISRKPSVASLGLLMTKYLEIESFIHLMSKSCGIPYLTMSIVTISVDVMYSNAALSDVLADPLDVDGLQFLRLLSSFVTWNYPLYIMACVCYRSHQLSNQVRAM